MRFLVFVLVLGWMATTASAQSYLDKKDADAIGNIERSLAKIDRIPQLFDGTTIPAGVDLQSVQGLYDQLSLHLKASRSAFFELSDKRARMPDAVKLRAKFDDLERYAAALGPVLSRAKTDQDTAKRKANEDNQRAIEVAQKVCTEFRDALRASGSSPTGSDYQRMSVLTNLADGHHQFFQTAEEVTAYKSAITATTALCKRWPTAGESCARISHIAPPDVRFCASAANGMELLQLGVKNMMAHHLKHSGPKKLIENFDHYQGYVDVDGVPTWADYMSGSRVKQMLAKRIEPILPLVNMTAADAEVLFGGLAKEYAELEAKARAAAPTWDLPGDPCSGPGCAQAKKFFQQWYRGSSIKRFLHTKPGWKILTNEFGIPTYRERYGYALVHVKGDPFCQLRMWTYSEPYAGGGRYTAGRDVHLHSVRWQTCK
ncbi:MAG: hypothetical protein ACKV2T_43485 [Kofleriaceae bacterium]